MLANLIINKTREYDEKVMATSMPWIRMAFHEIANKLTAVKYVER